MFALQLRTQSADEFTVMINGFSTDEHGKG